jgi:hypothetical protein
LVDPHSPHATIEFVGQTAWQVSDPSAHATTPDVTKLRLMPVPDSDTLSESVTLASIGPAASVFTFTLAFDVPADRRPPPKVANALPPGASDMMIGPATAMSPPLAFMPTAAADDDTTGVEFPATNTCPPSAMTGSARAAAEYLGAISASKPR